MLMFFLVDNESDYWSHMIHETYLVSWWMNHSPPALVRSKVRSRSWRSSGRLTDFMGGVSLKRDCFHVQFGQACAMIDARRYRFVVPCVGVVDRCFPCH